MEPRVVYLRPIGETSDRERTSRLFGGRVPESEQFRRYFGRAVNAATIENALTAAHCGYLRDLVDLGKETLGVDGHLASVVGRRIRSVATLPVHFEPATGDGINDRTAETIARFVQAQWDYVPNPALVLTSITWGLYDGRSCQEKIWRELPAVVGSDSPKWGIGSIAWVHPRRLALGPQREIRIRDDVWSWGQFEPRGFDTSSAPEKFITFAPRLFNDYPEREGLLPRALYFPWFKRFTYRERLALMEVYGKPWRQIEVMPDAQVTPEDLDSARAHAEQLGGNAVGALGRGLRLVYDQPEKGAGEIHERLIQDIDDELSKLVLGVTRTTDAASDGLGGQQSRVHQDSEEMVFRSDCVAISDVLTEQFAVDLVRLNWGESMLAYAPRAVVVYQPPEDPRTAAEVTRVAVTVGPVRRDEAYKRLGFTVPSPDDDVIAQQQVSVGPFGQDVPVGPGANAPKLQIGVAITESITTVNELRSLLDPPMGPLKLPSGVDDPDGWLTITEFKSKRSAKGEAEGEDAAVDAPEADEADDARQRNAFIAATALRRAVHFSAQPETVNGTPEVLVDAGVREGSRQTGKWADALAASVEGVTEPGAAFEALTRAARGLSMSEFARVAERRIMHAVMLGAMDSAWEVAHDEDVALVEFSRRYRLSAEPDQRFVVRPFAEALKLFRERDIVTKDRFNQLTNAAKRRAFTIARMARTEMLAVAHAELSRQIETTESSLKAFRDKLEARLGAAGWTPANASHVETIFRTNIVGAHSAGRHAQMTEPAVMELRPVWEWVGVGDDRQRPNHAAAAGTVLPATHEFWTVAFPPAGYNCRCRVVSRGKAHLDRVTSVPSGVPDPGFTAGTPTLLSSDF